jgi:dihydrodipicolinate synthase/N-acetylneuraminate lyase
MERDELRRLIRGPIATVPTPFDKQYRLDLGTAAELTRWWVDQGLVAGTTVIKVAAAMGEGPDLSDDEWPQLLRTVVHAADGKAAIVCGLKPKNTLHTIEDAKRAADLGAIGVQIDLPIFHHPVQDDYVRFFSDISDATAIGVMIYNTWWFGVPSLAVETIQRLADAEHIVAIKWSVPPAGGPDYDDMRQFVDRFNVIDNSLQWVRCYRNGGHGYINGTIEAYPPHELETAALLEAGRYEEAQARFDAVEVPLRAFMDKAAQRSGGYRVYKGMMAIMGHLVGPPRPPTLALDADELAELRQLLAGFGWPVASGTAAAALRT